MKKITKSFYIGEMTCVNCQNRIERALKKEQGVLLAEVDYRSGRAEVSFDAEKTDWNRLTAVIEGLGYTVSEQTGIKGAGYLSVIGQIAVIPVLFYILERYGILTFLVPGRLADSGMSYGMLFVIGLVTSVHCVAMCGGIGLSQSLPGNGGKKKQDRGLYIPNVLYNAGRVVSYTAIGFILGGIGFLIGGGQGVGLPVTLQGILKLAAGIVMVIMGVNLLGLFPSLKKLTLPQMGKLGGRLYRLIGGRNSSFAVGILNGLMPCGPMQAMWVVALASGSPLAGALSMLMFALGTVPLMLGLGSIVSYLGKRFAGIVTKAEAVLVVVMGLAFISQGSALAGMRNITRQPVVETAVTAQVDAENTDDTDDTEDAEDTEDTDDTDVQNVYSTLTIGEYPTITVEQGIPVRWTINAPEGSINGCNYRMIIPELDLEHSFEVGENIIEFTPNEAGTIPYTCWMGMLRGYINVVSGSGENADIELSEAAEGCCGE